MNKERILSAMSRYLKRPAFFYSDESFLGQYTTSEWNDYELWLFRNRLFTLHTLKDLHGRTKKMKRKPLISVIMPVYNPDHLEFRRAVDSILWQAYPYWELCIVDDLSDSRDYLEILGRLRDRRIKVYLRDVHSGIAETSQYAIEKAKGDYVALMDQDDELYPDALFCFAEVFQQQEIDYFYTDRDMISPDGKRYMHFFRPDWSPEYLLSFNYLPHLEIYHKQLLLDIGGFRSGYDGSQDYDLVLRATEQTEKIFHFPQILYSWRQSCGSVARDLNSKGYAFESGVRALKDALRRRGLPAQDVVENTSLWRGHYKIIWDEKRLADDISFVLVGGTDEEAARLKSLVKEILPPLKSVEFIAAGQKAGDINARLNTIGHSGYVFFCHESVTSIVSQGLIDMFGYLAIEGVGVVGSKFLDNDDKIFNSGLSIADSGKVLFSYRGSPSSEHGYGAVASVPRNVSAVLPSFWGCRVAILKQFGCLSGNGSYFYAAMHFFKEVIKSGQRIVCVPYMCLKIDRGRMDYDEDFRLFSEEWKQEGLKDRYYNPRLTDLYEDFGVR